MDIAAVFTRAKAAVFACANKKQRHFHRSITARGFTRARARALDLGDEIGPPDARAGDGALGELGRHAGELSAANQTSAKLKNSP